MPTKLTKDQLLKLEGIPDTVRADLTALFADIEERDSQIQTLRKKNEDADVIVSKAPALEKLNKEQAEKISLLNTQLAAYTGKQTDDELEPLEAFRPFIDFLSEG